MKTNKKLNTTVPTASIMMSINKRIPIRRQQETVIELKPSKSTPTVVIKRKKKNGILINNII